MKIGKSFFAAVDDKGEVMGNLETEIISEYREMVEGELAFCRKMLEGRGHTGLHVVELLLVDVTDISCGKGGGYGIHVKRFTSEELAEGDVEQKMAAARQKIAVDLAALVLREARGI